MVLRVCYKNIAIIFNNLIALCSTLIIESPDLSNYKKWWEGEDIYIFKELVFIGLKSLDFLSFEFFYYSIIIISTSLITSSIFAITQSSQQTILIFLLIPFLAINSGITIRQNLALAFFLYTYNKKSALFSIFFHYSVLPALIIRSRAFLFVLLLLSIVLIQYFTQQLEIIFEFINGKADIYANNRESNYLRVIFSVAFYIYIYWKCRRLNLGKEIMIILLSLILSAINPQLQRFGWFLIPIVIGKVLEKSSIKTRSICYLFMLTNFLMFFV